MVKRTAALVTLLVALLLVGCGGGEPSGDGSGAAASAETATAASPGQAIFERTCFACHSIGDGPRIGPDLKDVHQRRERDWLVAWIEDPIGMAQNDPIGQQIFAEWNNVPMAPSFLSEEEINQVIDYVIAVSEGTVQMADVGADVPETLTDEEFAQGFDIFFDRCAGCHGTLRAGATGPNIQPERTTQIGSAALKATLTHGLPGGMPAWGDAGILTDEEINIMARYVQMDPPSPPDPWKSFGSPGTSWCPSTTVPQSP